MLLTLTNPKEIFVLFLLCLRIKIVCECEGEVAVEGFSAALVAHGRRDVVADLIHLVEDVLGRESEQAFVFETLPSDAGIE